MKVVQKIGNNAAVCIDGKNRELVALGVGIGFPKCPYELTDLSIISKTFYGIDSNYFDLIENVDPKIFELCIDVIDLSSTILNSVLNTNAVFTLADHINFAIIRYNKGIHFSTPLSNELKLLYPNEIKIAKHAINLIKKKLNIVLPDTEVYGITMNIINSQEVNTRNKEFIIAESIIDDVVDIVEKMMNTSINKDSFNYYRFVSHMQFLLERRNKNEQIISDNEKMFTTLQREYPKTYECVLAVKDYFLDRLNWKAGNEELLYLILHINRLCSRENEGCND